MGTVKSRHDSTKQWHNLGRADWGMCPGATLKQAQNQGLSMFSVIKIRLKRYQLQMVELPFFF